MPKIRNENSRYRIQLRKAESDMIEYTLSQVRTLAAAADVLQVSKSFLSGRINKLGITLPSVAKGERKGRPRLDKPEAEGRPKAGKKKMPSKAPVDRGASESVEPPSGVPPDIEPGLCDEALAVDSDLCDEALAVELPIHAHGGNGNGAVPGIPPFSVFDASEDDDAETDV